MQTPKIPGLPLIDAGAQLITDMSIVHPNELVKGLLHQGTKAVVASGSKAGKTWILLDLALSVATGSNFLRWNTHQGRVLFINFEIQRAFMKDRLAAVMKRRNIERVDQLDFWNLRGKTADFEALVANIIKEVDGKNYALIILDPIYKAMAGKSENGALGVGALGSLLDRLTERSGAAVVFAHHFAKGDAKKKNAIDRMSGSGVFARDADTIITLTEHETTDCFTVEMILRNLPQQPAFVVQWEYPAMVEREDLDPEDVKHAGGETSETDEGLLELLKETPLRSGEWEKQAVALGLSRATFYRIKSVLKANGFVGFDAQTKTWNLVQKSEGENRETPEMPETATMGGRPSNAVPRVTEAASP